MDSFATFRNIPRDYIVEIWPIAAGQELLGVVQQDRKLHSIYSASKETGVGAFILEQFLIEAGAIAHDDIRPVSRRTFDAQTYADLLDEIPTLVGPIELRTAMGATRPQLHSLIEDRVLQPRIKIPTIKSPWRLADGLALVEELDALSISVDASDRSWEGIQQAKKRSGLAVGEIISAIRNGSLKVGHFSIPVGYAGFCVMKKEIDLMGRSKRELAEGPLITAAAFGRQVGNRTQGWLVALSAAGHTPVTCKRHPTRRGVGVYLSETDIEAFHSRFLTLTTMTIEFGQARPSLLASLREAGVSPFSPNGEDFGPLYLRRDIEAVLR